MKQTLRLEEETLKMLARKYYEDFRDQSNSHMREEIRLYADQVGDAVEVIVMTDIYIMGKLVKAETIYKIKPVDDIVVKLIATITKLGTDTVHHA